jgi:uncharacterized protein (DUF305 family)
VPIQPWMRLTVAAQFALAATHAFGAEPPMAGFARENDAAMAKMMAAMNSKSSGDADRDFAAMMIAHHQGAIDMAQTQLRYGKNEQLRRIAQEIIVDQLQEIAAMRMALNQPLPPSTPAPTQPVAPPAGSSSGHHPARFPRP